MKKKNEARIIENENLNKRPIFFLVSILILCAILVLFYYMALFFAPVNTIKYEGYCIEGKRIAVNLKSENFANAEQTVELLKVEEQETIYKKMNEYFVGGDEKRNIDINYPVYINEKAAVLNLVDNISLITNHFETIVGYPNFIVTEGSLYNSHDLTKADTNEYLFIRTKDDTYINTKELKITTQTKEHIIPINSIIYFTEEYITYYKIENDNLVYRNILDVTGDTVIEIAEVGQFEYQDLLIKVGVVEPEVEVVPQEKPKEEEPKEEPKEEKKEEKEEKPKEEPYIKPTIKASPFEPGVYTADTMIDMYDPQGHITEAIFVIKKNGKIYQRRAISGGGGLTLTGLSPETEYHVTGTYQYMNEQKKKVEAEFFNGKFKTKSLADLGTIILEHEPGQIYSNKIELKNIKTKNNSTDEVLAGITKIELEVDGIRYKILNKDINNLINNIPFVYQTSETVKSNKEVTYKFHIYDSYGNELSVENAEGKTRTSKEVPEVLVTPQGSNPDVTELGLSLKNKDNVELKNYYYVILESGREIVREYINPTDKLVTRSDLDPAGYYTICFYADFDLNDGLGIKKEQKIGEANFSTGSLSDLGIIYWETGINKIPDEKGKMVDDLEFSRVALSIGLENRANGNDRRLIQLIDYVELVVIDDEGEIVFTTELDKNILKAEEKVICDITGLNSNTQYTYDINTMLKQGNVEEPAVEQMTETSFITKRKPAEVKIENLYATEEFIDFDVMIQDDDGAVLTGVVSMELRSPEKKLLAKQNIQTNGEFERIIFDSYLEADKKYTIYFYAEQYNERSDRISEQKNNYLLHELQVTTTSGITGDLQFYSLDKVPKHLDEIGYTQPINLINMSSENNWSGMSFFASSGNYYGKSYDPETNTLKLNHTGTSKTGKYLYDLRDYVDLTGNGNKTVTLSFNVVQRLNGNKRIRIRNGKSGTTVNYDVNPGQTYQWTGELIDGYLGFEIPGSTGIVIDQLQVTTGGKKDYTKFTFNRQFKVRINLEDENEEITSKAYYLRLIKNGQELFTNEYIEIDENNKVENVIKSLVDEIPEGQSYGTDTYRIELLMERKGRYYVLDYYEKTVGPNDEIRAVSDLSEYLQIQPYGYYIVVNDLSFAGTSSKYYWNVVEWNGRLDFNGRTVYRESKDRTTGGMFNKIGKKGIIENLVVDIKFNRETEAAYDGVFYQNYGTIRNLVVKVTESKPLPNIDVRLMGYQNLYTGVIDGFIINLQEPIYGSRNITAGVYYNYGKMLNGYAIGKNIEATQEINSGQSRGVGVMAYYNYLSGIMENVYSLVSVNVAVQSGVTENTGNIILSNSHYSKARNMYSVGIGTRSTYSAGPNIYSYATIVNISNNYYFCDETFNNTVNLKTSQLALWDINFQNDMLNSLGAFEVDELVSLGFYPHLNMPNCMPEQEMIALPPKEDRIEPDITSATVLEKTTNEATVEFKIYDPNGEPVQDIQVESISTTILEDSYKDGERTVIAKLHSPTKYLSSYKILSFTTKPAYGTPKAVKYTGNERLIKLDLYREIYTTDDWFIIEQHPTENYILMNDLNFKEETNDRIVVNATFKGTFDGNNYTLTDMSINTPLFTTVNSGTINNLNIERINIEGSSSKAGLIGTGTTVTLTNIHIKDISIENNYTGTLYAGALLGEQTGRSNIQECSASNVYINIHSPLVIAAGGLVGRSSEGEFENCFVRNLDLNVQSAYVSNGVGGILGNYSGYTLIQTSYAQGKILSNVGIVGGIVGNLTNPRAVNCYSAVNVEANGDFIGGIAGKLLGDGGPSTGDLALGSIYAKNDAASYVQRIAGQTTKSDKHYAYEKQKINGVTSTDVMDANPLLTRDELIKQETYTEKMGWTESYDYSELEKGVLPKLRYLNSEELLPNQEDILIDDLSEPISIDTWGEPQQTPTEITGTIVFDNENNLKITKLNIENMDVVITENKYDEEDKVTTIIYKATPKLYFDNYKLTTVEYESEEGYNKKLTINRMINAIFYKEIANYQEWQVNIEKDAINQTYQNYRLVKSEDRNTDGGYGIIDFTKYNSTMTKNLTIGRLECELDDGDTEPFVLKGIRLSLGENYSGLIKNMTGSMKNIRFEDVKITQTKAISYAGLIATCSGNYENITFKDIDIDLAGSSYVGIIGRSYYGIMDGISLNGTISVKGASHVGGLIGYVTSTLVKNVTNDGTIYIKATSTYSGGLVGLQDGDGYVPTRINGVELTNVTVEGVSRAGCIVGQADITNAKISNSKVTGSSYVGGIGGYLLNNYNASTYKNLYVDNVDVIGTAGYIGGIGGYYGSSGNMIKNEVKNSYIEGHDNYVGGIAGQKSGNTNYCRISDSEVYSTANYVGGIVSYGTAQYCVVDNVKITGYRLVGGIAGEVGAATLCYCYVQADIHATQDTAGGLVGTLWNTGMTLLNQVSKIYNSYVGAGTTVTSKSRVGGIVGNSSEPLFDPNEGKFYYQIFIEANVEATDEKETASMGIGNRKTSNTSFVDTYFYEGSTLNGETVVTQNASNERIATENDTFEIDRYATLDQLKTTTFYSGKLKWTTSYFRLADVTENGIYPKLVNTNIPTQDGIPLPTGTLTSSLDSQEEVIESEEKQEEAKKIPTMVAYSVDVNKFNVDFSEVYEGLKLTYKSENTEEVTIDLTSRTCTFEYNYQVPVTLTISNGELTETVTINPEDISGVTSIVDGKVVYLNGNELSINNSKIDGTFVNIYDDLALMQNGNIYNIKEDFTTENNQVELALVETVTKETYDYNGNIIETFGTYSVVNGVESDLIYTVKNQSLSITDGLVENISSDKIVDNYNGNEYETVLGTDGMLHDLKTKINYPKDFVNQDITSMSVDIESKQAVVTYENGDVLGFDYMTGKETYENISESNEMDENSEEPISFMTYLMNQITGTDEKKNTDSKESSVVENTESLKETTNNDSKETLTTTYEETKELEEKLEEKPIESDTGTNADYVTVYDSTTDSYEIYKEDSLLNIKEDEEIVESETQKIAASQDLKEYYMTAKGESLENDKGAYFVIGSITGVFVALIILRNYIIKRRRKNILAKKKARDRKRNQQ